MYKRKLQIVYTDDVDAYAARIIKRYPKMDDNIYKKFDGSTLAWSLYELAEYDIIFIILPKGCGPAVLGHEAVHIADEIIEFFGLEGTETRAYLVQHIIEHVYN